MESTSPANVRRTLDPVGRRLLAAALAAMPAAVPAGPRSERGSDAGAAHVTALFAAAVDDDGDQFRRELEAAVGAAAAAGGIGRFFDEVVEIADRLTGWLARSDRPEGERALASLNRLCLDVVGQALAAYVANERPQSAPSEREELGRIVHKLRTPLASIKACAELLLDGVEQGDTAMRRQFCLMIDGEADRLAGLIDDLSRLQRPGDSPA